MTDSPSDLSRSERLSPDEAFSLLGNETRVGVLRALWDAFESGTGDNAVPFSELYDAVEIRDTGNFSYHLEKLTGPFVRSTDEGYELKQTGINVVRAVLAGTVTTDPQFGPTQIDVACPICDAPVEVTYADELMTVHCTACLGMRRWKGRDGLLFASLVPPAGILGRSIEEAFKAGIGRALHQAQAFRDGICPHCAGSPETTLDVCPNHRPSAEGRCPTCDWLHMAEVWFVCSTCKRSMFPPVRAVVLDDPRVTAFYHDHGIQHQFSTWEGVARSFEVGEELVSDDPVEMRFTIPAGDDALELTVDEELDVIEVRA